MNVYAPGGGGYGGPPPGPQKSGCVAALLGWFIPGAGQMYAGQVGCGVLALIACLVLNGAGIVIWASLGALSGDPSTNPNLQGEAAILLIVGGACMGLAFLIWLISFIMGIVAAGSRR